MKAHLGLPEALIEYFLIAIGPLYGIEQMYVVRHCHLEQGALDFNLVGHRGREFVIGATDVRPVLLLASGRSATRAFERYMIQKRCFRIGYVRDFVGRYAELVGRVEAVDMQLASAHADHVSIRADADEKGKKPPKHAFVAAGACEPKQCAARRSRGLRRTCRECRLPARPRARQTAPAGGEARLRSSAGWG